MLKFLKWIHWILNPAGAASSWLGTKAGQDQANFHLNGESGFSNWFDRNLPGLSSLWNKFTGQNLTGAEQQANQFNAEEAQKQRDWEEYMSNTAFQRQVDDMQKAGVNPALLYGSGSSGATTPSGSSASSVTPNSLGMSMSDLMHLFMLPVQKKLVQAQAKLASDQGEAALINAGANVRNAASSERQAGAAERNAGTNEFNAETNRMRQEIDAWKARYDIEVSKATVDRLAEETAQIREVTRQLPDRLEILKQQASAQERSSYAALQSALAQTRQAAVSEKLSDSEIAVREAQAFVHWANGEGQKICNQYLDDKMMKEIGELDSRAGFLDANARNLDRNAKVQWMQTITGYTNAACNIANTVFNGVGTFSGMSKPVKIGF